MAKRQSVTQEHGEENDYILAKMKYEDIEK